MAILTDPVLFLDTSCAAAFDGLKQYYRVPGFRLGGAYDLDDEASYELGGTGGTTLESLGAGPCQIGYITLGTPHRGPDGEIDNAILISSFYSGDSTNYLDFWGPEGARTGFSEGVYLGPGKIFDTDRYYLILADSLGLWGASKPSSSHPGDPASQALGLRFPQYSLLDCAQLTYRLLVDHLGIKRLKLATGVSMGASLSYVMAVLHPDFPEAIMPIGGTPYQARGMSRWQFDLMTAAVQSDPIYRETKGDYYDRPRLEQPLLGNLFGWSIIRQSAFIDEVRVKQPLEQYQLEAFDWEKSVEVVRSQGTQPGWGSGLFFVALIDANDLIYRNRAQTLLDLEDELHRVRARTLIVHLETDQWLYPHIARAAHERIPGSRLVTFRHDLGHYGVFMAPGREAEAIGAFLEGRA